MTKNDVDFRFNSYTHDNYLSYDLMSDSVKTSVVNNEKDKLAFMDSD